MRIIAMLGKRIFFGYAGATMVSLPMLLPYYFMRKPDPMFAFMTYKLAFIGLLLAFGIHDWKRQLTLQAITMRTIIALVAPLVFFVLIDSSEMPFLIKHEKECWEIGVPLVAAVASEFVLRESKREQSAEKKLA